MPLHNADVEIEGMATAPPGARAVAARLHEMLFARADVNLFMWDGSESDVEPEIVVVSNIKDGGDMKSALCAALGVGGHTEAAEDARASASLLSVDWNKHSKRGFHVDPDADCDGNEDAGEEAELVAMTRVMADDLTGHFRLEYDDEVVAAPVLLGGVTAEGAGVAVLYGRVWT